MLQIQTLHTIHPLLPLNPFLPTLLPTIPPSSLLPIRGEDVVPTIRPVKRCVFCENTTSEGWPLPNHNPLLRSWKIEHQSRGVCSVRTQPLRADPSHRLSSILNLPAILQNELAQTSSTPTAICRVQVLSKNLRSVRNIPHRRKRDILSRVGVTTKTLIKMVHDLTINP